MASMEFGNPWSIDSIRTMGWATWACHLWPVGPCWQLQNWLLATWKVGEVAQVLASRVGGRGI